jgi:tetratricopeptide (TPR) repeat protein
MVMLRFWTAFLLVPLAAAAAATTRPRPIQPEDKLLDPDRLRAELLRRGMNDLLQVYLTECPPVGEAEKLIYEREVQLAVYADKSRDEDECLAALDKAISLLEEAIARHPDDKRVLDWRLQLGKDLIYKRAEPYYNNILFRGGSQNDREGLLAIASRATQVFDELNRAIDRWNQSLQGLSEAELRKRENSGETARYRALELDSKYFTSWARFYRALASPPDRTRDELVKGIIDYLTVEKKDWIETDHRESGVQCQSLLLLGMTYRLAGDGDKALEYLRRAVEKVNGLADPAEKRNLQWVGFLGRMEQIKVHRDAGRYREALEAIRAMTQGMADEPQSLSIELAAALLEGSIYQKQAEAAAARKDNKAAAEFSASSRQPLIALANRRPQAKARIYGDLYPLLGKVDDAKALAPFDKAVYVAGLLGDAVRARRRMEVIRKTADGKLSADAQRRLVRLDGERAQAFDKAIEVAELLLADQSAAAADLRPEAMFNLAVCHYQRGKSLKAIEVFARLARDYPKFSGSREAAVYAVQIAAEMNRLPENRSHAEPRSAFLTALQTLIKGFPDSPEARYWQFFLANTLDLAGDYRQAAVEYGKVDPGHENYLDARYHRVNAMVNWVESWSSSQPADKDALRGEAAKVASEAASCADLLGKSLDKITEPRRRSEIEQDAGNALLTAARFSNEPLGDYAATLRYLDGFENRFGPYREMIGRAMRLRIVAFQGLNRIDQAKQLIPDYLKRDPENAGATLSALLISMQQEVQRARERNESAKAEKAALEAVELARWLNQWAQDNRQRIKPDELFGIRVQLAQAYLEARQYEEARKGFQECFEEDAARSPNGQASHGPTLVGLGESHYRLGQQMAKAGQFEQARKELTMASQHFMAVWRRAEPHTPVWWQAFLRGLEVAAESRDAMIAQLEQLRRGRELTPDEKKPLSDISSILDRAERTINAERMGDPQLGGHVEAFARLTNRIAQLRQRAERLGQ